MGDGPGYDYAYARAAEREQQKYATQRRRRDMLLGIYQHVGFGDNDGELTRVEAEAAKHLILARDLLDLIIASKSHLGPDKPA